MEAHELHRGRLIDHLQLVVKDLAASKRFYSAAFGWEFNDYGPDSNSPIRVATSLAFGPIPETTVQK